MEVTVIGPDKTGIVASVTNYIFRRNGNVEEVNQNVLKGTFYMTLRVSLPKVGFQKERFENGLMRIGKKMEMDIQIRHNQPKKLQNMAILVTKEHHVLEALLDAKKRGDIRVNVPLIIGTTKGLERIAKEHKIPFFAVEQSDRDSREEMILTILKNHKVDFVVLARYMKILSPKVVWMYPNRIINIHPSLLPSFPGALAYMQTYERGVMIAGATAHFVTVELDQGPIIWQESLVVKPNESLESIKRRGRVVEAKTIVKAVSLFINSKLESRWGKVSISQ